MIYTSKRFDSVRDLIEFLNLKKIEKDAIVHIDIANCYLIYLTSKKKIVVVSE